MEPVSSQQIPKNTQIPSLMKIYPVGAELLHADRRTDRQDEYVFFFRNFGKKKRPKTSDISRLGCDTIYSCRCI